MKKRRAAMIAAALAALTLVTVLWVARGRQASHIPDPVGSGEPNKAFLTAVGLGSAPADVQAAADILKSSRVGYAMVKPDKTYLIISTGSVADKVAYDRAEGQPSMENPDFVDLFFKSSLTGESLMIATTPLTRETEYQFDVDDKYADIPTLYNRHNLPLVPLNAATGFALVRPIAGFQAQAGLLEVEGYAQVFESAFIARLLTEKGRVISQTSVMSAAGAPSWGSFSFRMKFDDQNAPETGFLELSDEMTSRKLVVPIRFRPAQLG